MCQSTDANDGSTASDQFEPGMEWTAVHKEFDKTMPNHPDTCTVKILGNCFGFYVIGYFDEDEGLLQRRNMAKEAVHEYADGDEYELWIECDSR